MSLQDDSMHVEPRGMQASLTMLPKKGGFQMQILMRVRDVGCVSAMGATCRDKRDSSVSCIYLCSPYPPGPYLYGKGSR